MQLKKHRFSFTRLKLVMACNSLVVTFAGVMALRHATHFMEISGGALLAVMGVVLITLTLPLSPRSITLYIAIAAISVSLTAVSTALAILSIARSSYATFFFVVIAVLGLALSWSLGEYGKLRENNVISS